jgi:hypothetical protein
MLLRDHPLMTHHGAHSWPPTWVWAGGLEKAEPQGGHVCEYSSSQRLCQWSTRIQLRTKRDIIDN